MARCPVSTVAGVASSVEVRSVLASATHTNFQKLGSGKWMVAAGQKGRMCGGGGPSGRRRRRRECAIERGAK